MQRLQRQEEGRGGTAGITRRAWGRTHRFGYRGRVEGAFSVIKRIFGEYVVARKFANMAGEIAMKADIYNGFISMA